jgi:hypothetical protein
MPVVGRSNGKTLNEWDELTEINNNTPTDDDSLPWETFQGDPGDELCELAQVEPSDDAPLRRRVLWHERTIACWEQIAARDTVFAENAAFLIDLHGRKLTALRETAGGT